MIKTNFNKILISVVQIQPCFNYASDLKLCTETKSLPQQLAINLKMMHDSFAALFSKH